MTKNKENPTATEAQIIVVMPNNNEIPVDLPIDTEAKDILKLLSSTGNDPALNLAKVDKDETDDKTGVRKITLKTNAQRKGL